MHTRQGQVASSFEQGINLRVQSNAEIGNTESSFMGNHWLLVHNLLRTAQLDTCHCEYTYSQPPIKRHPHLAPMKACEQVQYSVLHSVTAYRHPRYRATNCSEQTVALYRDWTVIIYYRYSALGPVMAETRAQSGDWYGSGTLHPGQILRGSLPLLSTAFRRSNFHHQVPPRRERSQRRKVDLWARILSGNFVEMTTSMPLRDLSHAPNLRHGIDGFTSPPKEGVLRIFSPLKIRRLRPGLNPRTWILKASTLPLDHRSRLIGLYVIIKYTKQEKFKILVFTNVSASWEQLQHSRPKRPP
jgi:hypothetical protein